MRRRRPIVVVVVLLVVVVVGGVAAALVALTGEGTRSPRAGLTGIADRVVRGATAALMRAEQAPAGAEGLHVVLPDAAIRPPAGTGPPSTDSTAAATYAGAGWRAALIAVAAALGVPSLTDFVATDRAGAQAPGAAFYLDGTVRTTPGQSIAAGMTKLGRVSGAAVRRQLDDNIRTLRAGLPAGSLRAATVTPLAVAGGTALAVELRVADLRRLTPHLGDLLSGLATGLAPGRDSTVEGLAIHAVDAGGRNVGSWIAARAQQGTTVIDPRLHPPAVLAPRLRFVDETGGPAAVPSARTAAQPEAAGARSGPSGDFGARLAVPDDRLPARREGRVGARRSRPRIPEADPVTWRRRRAGPRRRQALAVGVAVVASLGLAASGGPAGARPAARGWVTVPRVTETIDVTVAYARLRRAGLRTAIPRPFAIGSLCRPSPGSQSPAAGARVAAGTTVVLRGLRCPLGSPAGGDQQAVVPDVTGRTASTAVQRAEAAGLYWQLDRLPPLAPSRRRSLLDNYVVTAESPAAGTVLARGVDCSTYASRCYRPTPLRLAARVRRG